MPDLTTFLPRTPAAAFGGFAWLEQESRGDACSTDQNHFSSDQVLMEHAGLLKALYCPVRALYQLTACLLNAATKHSFTACPEGLHDSSLG